MPNANTRVQLDGIVRTVRERLRDLRSAPSVQMQKVPPPFWTDDRRDADKDEYDDDDDDEATRESKARPSILSDLEHIERAVKDEPAVPAKPDAQPGASATEVAVATLIKKEEMEDMEEQHKENGTREPAADEAARQVDNMKTEDEALRDEAVADAMQEDQAAPIKTEETDEAADVKAEEAAEEGDAVAEEDNADDEKPANEHANGDDEAEKPHTDDTD